MTTVKPYSIALLVAGIVMIAGSCVPLARTLWPGTPEASTLRLPLPPGGGQALLDVSESRETVPVVRLELFPAPAGDAPVTLRYGFSIEDGSGRSLIDRSGSATLEPGDGGRPPTLELRFGRVAIPAGEWTVRFDTGRPVEVIRDIELRLEPPSAGALAALLAALGLAILGWLAASLGALYWIRSEAALPGASACGDASSPAGEERLWTVACHFSALLGYLFPFGHVLGPLAVWLAKRGAFPGVERAGRDVLNFQLSATLYVLVALFLSFFLIGLVILFLVIVFHFSMILHATLRAQRGLEVRYPLTIKII